MSTNSIAAGMTLSRMRKLRQHFEPRVGHGHDAEVRIDRAEGIIRRLRLAGAGDGVEESRFADVRQTDDSGAEHKEKEER